MMTYYHKIPGGFYGWMMANHLDGHNRFARTRGRMLHEGEGVSAMDVKPTADLARDMHNDYTFPREDDFDAILDYLEFDCGAASACIAVFRECWEMYQEALVYA